MVALGPGRHWFRYHALLAELLRHRLLIDQPDIVPELHLRASAWFAANGEPLEAIRHAIRAPSWQLVGDLMVRSAAVRALSAERQAFAALLAEIPATELGSSAELRACGALRRFLLRDYDGLARQVVQARAQLRERDEVGRAPVEVVLRALDMVLTRIRGDLPALMQACHDVLHWTAVAGPVSRAAQQFEGPALSNLGLGLLWSGRDAEAESCLRSALTASTEAGTELTLLNTQGHLALLELTEGT